MKERANALDMVFEKMCGTPSPWVLATTQCLDKELVEEDTLQLNQKISPPAPL